MADINAASTSLADVRAAIALANNGDRVLVPAGSATWTECLDSSPFGPPNDGTLLNKRIELIGAGIDQTIITDGTLKSGFPNVPHLLRWDTIAGGLSRISGFTFQGGANDITDGGNYGMILIRGNSEQFRMDNCKIIQTKTTGMFFNNYVRGVIDHCIFDLSDVGFAVYVMHESWGNIGGYGDNSWAQADNVNSDQALFFEDNQFLNDKTGPGATPWQRYAMDGWQGHRIVVRRNTFTNCTWGNHGTESGGRQRSARRVQLSQNTFNWDMSGNTFPSVAGSRGGEAYVFGNVVNITNGNLTAGMFDLNYYRASGSFAPWGQADGANVWDENQSGAYRALDQPGVGEGDLITGDTPINSAFGVAQWPRQVLKPNYIWGNTVNGVTSPAVSHQASILENRDFYNNAPPGGYTEYTYPHPLVGGAPPAPTVTTLSPDPASFQSGVGGNLTVTINAVQAGNTTVALTSSVPAVATVPASVNVLAGQLTALVPVTALSAGSTLITATLNATSQDATVNISDAPPPPPPDPPPPSPGMGGAAAAGGLTAPFTKTISFQLSGVLTIEG